MRSVLLILFLSSCGWVEREREEAAVAARQETIARIERGLSEAARRADRMARSADRILSPLPVMTRADEAALRRFLNAAHVRRARELGVRAADQAALEGFVETGRLVELDDSTLHWVVRPGSAPAHVVPSMRALLELLGTRFQTRLSEIGVPPYRIEVTSSLRTAERQARLRRSNSNAAAGVSSHEFGTTVDLSYAAFAPPANPPAEIFGDVPSELVPHMGRLVDLAFESVAARKSRELGAIFSDVLQEAQAEGLALVIYERQQTVYHVTVAGPLGVDAEADSVTRP